MKNVKGPSVKWFVNNLIYPSDFDLIFIESGYTDALGNRIKDRVMCNHHDEYYEANRQEIYKRTIDFISFNISYSDCKKTIKIFLRRK